MPALSDITFTRLGWSFRPTLCGQLITTRHVAARWRMPRADVTRGDGENGSVESISRSFAIDSPPHRKENGPIHYPTMSID